MKIIFKRCVPVLLVLVVLMLNLKPEAYAATDLELQIETADAVLGREDVAILSDGDLASVGSLTLSEALPEDTYYTFSSYIRLSGQAPEGARITIVSYTLNDNGRPIIWYDEQTVVGASGLYEAKLSLKTYGPQWVMILNEDGDTAVGRCCLFDRKEESIEDTLLDFQLNIYEEYGRP